MRWMILLLAMAFTACSQPKKEAVQAVPDSQLPKLALTIDVGKKISVDTLKGKMILVFYNPTCDHCQREAQYIKKDIGLFSTYKIYFISASTLEDGKLFAKDYGLESYNNIIFAHAEIPEVVNVMGSIGTPSIYIYSSDNKLVKQFDKETEVSEMAKFL